MLHEAKQHRTSGRGLTATVCQQRIRQTSVRSEVLLQAQLWKAAHAWQWAAVPCFAPAVMGWVGAETPGEGGAPYWAGGVFRSAARVVLVGHGADEQCGGYGRHRSRFRTHARPRSRHHRLPVGCLVCL